MECWPVLLLWGLPQIWASSEALRPPGRSPRLSGPRSTSAPPGSVGFRGLQVSSFANSSWTRTDGSGWLGPLQTHSWSNGSDIRCLRPWSREKPEAWLSSGPPPGPGRLLLVCHVSGFHPEPVWVRWMQGQQELPGAQQGDVLPNADGTWYLRVTLDVAAGEAAGLACRVRHSSLGGQDIVLSWEGSHVPVGLIVTVVLASLLLIGGGIAFWHKKRCSYQDIL
uniref:Ig-like domain-containing protein n=1 Tax=Pipistrellus kuhlii TaxID=59472 RepID=A0A7J7UTF9_PIPKU|nr:hypothetical protein mPipKuh1_008682 [Pipistrellus kuhlii]